MPTPADLQIALDAEATLNFESMLPTTPGRPPSPKDDDQKSEDDFVPEPPPPRASASVPASFRTSKYRALRNSNESSAPSSNLSSRPTSALPSRNGSPAWKRPSSAWGKLTSGRQVQTARLYSGRESYGGKEERMSTQLGQFGPSMYDVRCSKTGSPKGAKYTPSFGQGPRFDREKCYEGKENMKPGQFGPGLYDIRCFKTGSPKGTAKGTPRFGRGERFDRERCYEGRLRSASLFGQAGATCATDAPRCSNRGSPLWKNRPSAAFALPHVPRLRRVTA